jgi:hypothetical protein
VATTAKGNGSRRALPTRRRPASASLTLAEARRRPDTTEVGDNAVSWAYGSGGNRRLRDPEYLYELVGRQGGRIYQRMRWSDPHIAGLRRAQNMPLLRAAASVEPADKEDPDAVEKADFIKHVLLEDFPWRSFVSDTCLALDYGFAPFEIVWRMEDGKARFRLALRPSASIAPEDIYVVDGAIDHIVQRPDTGGEYTIPGEKLLWFAHEKEGDLFTGRPILRAMHKPWKLKEDAEVDLSVIRHKLGGIPDITTIGDPDSGLAGQLDAAGASFGIDAEGFFRHTEDVTVQLLSSSSTSFIRDVLDEIKQHNVEITAVCQAQVLDLGTSNAGSRALGTTLGDMFNDSIQAQASVREDVLNARNGLIHQAISYNFSSDDNLPKLRFGNVQRADMKSLAQALLFFQNTFGTLDEETQEWARSEMNMPAGTTTQVVVPPAPAKVVPPQSPAAAGDTPTGDGQPPEGGAQASEAPHSHAGLQLSELRPPRGVEVYLNLAELVAQFDTAKTAVKDATQATREALAKELVRRARTAADKGQLPQFAAGAPPMVDKLTAEISTVLSDFYAAGKQQVAGELRRQKDGKPWSPDDVGARITDAEKKTVNASEGYRLRQLAEAVRTCDYKLAALDPQQRRATDIVIKQQAEAMARAIATSIQAAAAVQAAHIAANTPVSEAAMVTAVTRESDGAALRFVGAVSDQMSMGRADEAQAQAQDIEDAVYSALLDGATCAVCEPMDGETTTDLPLAEGWTPNPECEGTADRCRCLVVYQIRQDQGASA